MKQHFHPARTFVLAFLALTALGTALLMLPMMTTLPSGLSLLSAGFTAVSATCLVGLTVVNTATELTLAGQVVVVLLVQAGGLMILTFALSAFDKQATVTQIFRQVVRLTLLVEAVATLVIFYSWGGYPFDSLAQRLFFSIFYAISAFCNAGFGLFADNLHGPIIRQMYVLHLALLATWIVGGIGFRTLHDFSIPKLRERLANPALDWTHHTKISLYVSAGLLTLGTLSFYTLEQSHTLAEANLTEGLIASVFQSATARTAGFTTVDFSQVTGATLLLWMLLMFVGGERGSTAGGVKIATVYSAAATLFSGKKTAKARSSWSIIGYAIGIDFLGTVMLYFFETDRTLLPLAFEQVSAFASVGLSTGITHSLTSASQFVLIVSMLLGRIGVLLMIHQAAKNHLK